MPFMMPAAQSMPSDGAKMPEMRSMRTEATFFFSVSSPSSSTATSPAPERPETLRNES